MDGIGAYKTPGQLLRDLLSSRGWSQRVLSMVSGLNPSTLNQIISGKKRVDADLALILAEVFNVEVEMFMELQKQYDLAQAQIVSRPDPNRGRRARLLADLPITEMTKRGWLVIDDPSNLHEIESALVKFFGASSPDEIEILPHATKKTAVNTPPTPAQLAWLYRVKEIAEELLVPKYSHAALKKALTKLHPLTVAPEEARKVPRILAECGIRFVIVESLPSAKVDGVCFWLNDGSPVVGLSMRYNRIDHFWFVLRHELEHVRLRHGRSAMMLDTELEGERAGTNHTVPQEERAANAAAQEFCVPSAQMDRFVERKAPLFTERDLLGFAKILGVHPGLVAGQLQHRTGRYDRFRQHLATILDNIRTSASVDGWGDVYPLGAKEV